MCIRDRINGTRYPRIDKVDEIAKYFGISRSNLTEKPIDLEPDPKQDFITDVVIRLQSDENFYALIEEVMALDSEKLPALNNVLDSLHILAKQPVNEG